MAPTIALEIDGSIRVSIEEERGPVLQIWDFHGEGWMDVAEGEDAARALAELHSFVAAHTSKGA